MLGLLATVAAMAILSPRAPKAARPIGAAFFDECLDRGAITCNEAAIYHAAWEQQRGCEAWVHIVRPDGGTPHAVVYYPAEDSYYDPSREMLNWEG